MENVKTQYSDEYNEVHDIRGRYNTLNGVQGKLREKVSTINEQLEEKKMEVANYERSMETKIMSLNNDIANLTKECEKVEAEKSSLQSSEEEASAKKWDAISELSQVIFAIEMIEVLCAKRPGLYQTQLPYAKASRQHETFDSFAKCEELSIAQLENIGQFLKDFKEILNKFNPHANAKPGAHKNGDTEEDSEEQDH